MKDNDVRLTPPELFAELQDLYGPRFQMDVCATHSNAKCGDYYTLQGRFALVWTRPHYLSAHEESLAHIADHDGLTGPWADHWYCNPPYSNIEPWVQKAWAECKPGLMVIPASKTEQKFWAEGIEPYRDRDPKYGGLRLETRFLKGRRRFLDEEGQPIYARNKDGSFKLDDSGQKIIGSPKWGLVALVWRQV